MGIVLWVVSFCLRDALAPFAFIHTVINAIRWGGKWKHINAIALHAALANDVYGNMAYKDLLNAWFIKHDGYHYGEKGETISSATGKGWLVQGLAFLGLCLCAGLNFIDVSTRKKGGHCLASVDDPAFLLLGEPRQIPWYYAAFGVFGIAVAVVSGLIWRVLVAWFVINGLWDAIK